MTLTVPDLEVSTAFWDGFRGTNLKKSERGRKASSGLPKQSGIRRNESESTNRR